MMIWPRPAELFTGITRAVSWAFLTTELQHIPGHEVSGCVIIPAAGPNEAVEVSLFLVGPSAEMGGSWPGERDMKTQFLGEAALRSGERLLVVHRTFVPPQFTIDDLARHRRGFSHLKDTPTARARFAIVGVNNIDQSRFIVEGAVHPDVT